MQIPIIIMLVVAVIYLAVDLFITSKKLRESKSHVTYWHALANAIAGRIRFFAPFQANLSNPWKEPAVEHARSVQQALERQEKSIADKQQRIHALEEQLRMANAFHARVEQNYQNELNRYKETARRCNDVLDSYPAATDEPLDVQLKAIIAKLPKRDASGRFASTAPTPPPPVHLVAVNPHEPMVDLERRASSS
jgi:DNA anti-recombination protein RmuC